MSRFDVYANPETAERKLTPYFLDVQNEFIDTLITRMVIPMRREASFGARARDLNPSFSISNQRVVLDTAALASVPRAVLRRPVANLKDESALIQEALDTLFGAF